MKVTLNPEHEKYATIEDKAWDTYRRMVAERFARQFDVPVDSVTVVTRSDNEVNVCCAGRIWVDFEYQDAMSEDKTFYDVSDIDNKTMFEFEWTNDERALLDALAEREGEMP